MDASACPRVCVPHTVFQKVSVLEMSSHQMDLALNLALELSTYVTLQDPC